MLFHWRNDTPSFVTWRSRLATATDTHTCIVIHCDQFTDGVHPQISSFLRLLVLCLVRHILLIVPFFFFFSKNLFLSSAPLTNATPSFSTLWFKIVFKGLLLYARLYSELFNIGSITGLSIFQKVFGRFSRHEANIAHLKGFISTYQTQPFMTRTLIKWNLEKTAFGNAVLRNCCQPTVSSSSYSVLAFS